jgi:hypothetical protein
MPTSTKRFVGRRIPHCRDDGCAQLADDGFGVHFGAVRFRSKNPQAGRSRQSTHAEAFNVGLNCNNRLHAGTDSGWGQKRRNCRGTLHLHFRSWSES